MIDVPLAYAFTAGLVASVNPCGFPMLPAYLSWFIGTDDESADPSSRVPRALLSGLAVSIGFFAVFAALGVPINAGVDSIQRWMPWLTMVVGLTLGALGVSMLLGYRLKVTLPRLDRGGHDRRFRSMVVFGMSYAIASLSCTIPIFLSVVAGTTHRANAASGLLAFLAYAAGMSLVLMVLSLAIALARESMVRRLRAVLPYTDQVAAILLVLVGAYLLYYGIYAVDTGNTGSAPVGVVEDWSSRASVWLANGGVELGLVLAGVVGAGAAWAAFRRRAA